MSRAARIIFLTAAYAVAAPVYGRKEIEFSAAYQRARYVETFPDPLYVGETDYLAGNASQARAMAQLTGFYIPKLTLAYQALSVSSASDTRQNNSYHISGYFSSYLSAMAAKDTGVLRWHYGFAALVTFGYRSSADAAGKVVSDRAIDTRLSQAYPAGGFTLFPLAPIRFSMIFLNGDTNLLYGWLRLQAEFETAHHIFMPAFEMLNHASFGKGLPNFVQPPGAFNMGYAYKLGDTRLGVRLGFVLNSRQGFENARVTFADRLLFEFSVAWRLKIPE